MRVVPPEFIAVTGVSLNKTAAAILVGGTETLTATITPANATNQNITWSSSNGSVATVDNTGLVNAMAAGTATIAVTTEDGGFTAVCAVAVAYGISLSPTGPVIFPTAIVGYGAQTTQAVTVTNTWNEATGALMVGLSGTDSGSFTLSTTAIGSIALSDTAAFTVGPNTGLAAGTYTATVTVSGSNGISADFAVSFMVTPLPGTQSVHTINNVNVPFRYVPAGSFQRDSTTANVSIITIGYWMGEMEVTQELFQAVMGANPSNFPSGADGGETQNQRPVESVSWYAAIAFCNKLSILDGKDPVYSVSGVSNWATLAYSDIPISDNTAWNAAVMDTSKNGYRLPTEMEWMWAAMGADKTVQPNTTGYSKAFAGDNGTNSIDNYTWYNSNSNSKTHEVGKKSANELGLYDMSGNVHEWCWDGHGSYPGGNQMDYTGATSDTDRVNRGGSWSSSAPLCAFNARGAGSPGSGSFIGFRVVCP
jgi:formylglycine-generating enzyme required for sulfatase activity